MGNNDIWIVLDYEGTLVYTGDLQGAKIQYEKELEIAERDLNGEYLDEGDMGLQVILAKVDKALNLYMDKDDDGNDMWQMEYIESDSNERRVKKYYVAKDEKGCYWRGVQGSYVLENRHLFANINIANEYAEKHGYHVVEVILKETSNLVNLKNLKGVKP